MPQLKSRPAGTLEYWGTQEAKGRDSEFLQRNDGLDKQIVEEIHGLTAHLYFLETRIHMYREALAVLQPWHQEGSMCGIDIIRPSGSPPVCFRMEGDACRVALE
jgi:hypothetical protein